MEVIARKLEENEKRRFYMKNLVGIKSKHEICCFFCVSLKHFHMNITHEYQRFNYSLSFGKESWSLSKYLNFGSISLEGQIDTL